jgi:hypothetical protein
MLLWWSYLREGLLQVSRRGPRLTSASRWGADGIAQPRHVEVAETRHTCRRYCQSVSQSVITHTHKCEQHTNDRQQTNTHTHTLTHIRIHSHTHQHTPSHHHTNTHTHTHTHTDVQTSVTAAVAAHCVAPNPPKLSPTRFTSQPTGAARPPARPTRPAT